MNSKEHLRILHGGDNCLILDLGETISIGINRNVQRLNSWIRSRSFPGLIETVPTYRSLAVYFEPCLFDPEDFCRELEDTDRLLSGPDDQVYTTIQIPVFYGDELGPDLHDLALYHGLSEEEVIQIHSGPVYYCYMLGFTPGFPYLGGLDPRIATPRLEEPRKVIPPGSVGIAGSQTGIYPIESPGGWRLIGRTPLILFDPALDPPVLIQPGWKITFRPVSSNEYHDIHQKVLSGNYNPEIHLLEEDQYEN